MFLPFTPIMSALSASTPILKGQLSDHDLRWEIIEQAVDCRVGRELDQNDKFFLPKSRYSTVSHYISNHEYVQDFHNDIRTAVCDQALKLLSDNGVDERLSYHVASLFRRAPIPVYEKELMFSCCDEHECKDHKK